MTELYITKELLELKGACAKGIAYFERLFPEGCALTDENINKVRDCKVSFIWWFTENICPDKRLYALCGVIWSKGVNGSKGVSWSEGVSGSEEVDGSNGVWESKKVSWSEGVSESEEVDGSNGVWESKKVSWSEGVSGSIGVKHSKGVSDSIGIVNCHGVSNALFLADVPQKYTLFGQEVSEGHFEEVKHRLCRMLDDWRPQCYDEEGREVSNQEAWADMPQKAIDYVRSWPEFDPAMFERITGIGTEKA